MNIADFLIKQATTLHSHCALETINQTWTYSELNDQVDLAANYLRERGLQPGNVVAVSMVDEALLLITYFAIARIGATVIPVPVHYPDLQKTDLMTLVSASFLVCDRQPAEAQTKAPPVILINDGLLTVYRQQGGLLQSCSDQPSVHQPAFIIPGSGSTGKAKLLPLSHEATWATAQRLKDNYKISQNDRVASHIHLNFLSCFRRALAALQASGTFIILPKKHWRDVSILRRMGVTYLNSTVFHVETMGTNQENSMPFLRVLSIGGSMVSNDLRRRITTHLTRNLFITYGANECGDVSLATPEVVLSPLDNVGRPLADTELEIVDIHQNPVPPGQIGQIRVRTPAMISGYQSDPVNTQRFFKSGWFYPGDLAFLSSDGILTYRGRADEMMIMNGINIYPSEIESALLSHPLIKDICAFPVKHPIAFQIPVCAVTLEEGASISEQALLQFAKAHLGTKAPRRIVQLEFIPRNERGKIIRKELYQAYKSRVSQ